MRLLRISRIRGHRTFRAFNWPADLHAFAQFNVIYGWNGAGKTTLAALLAHLEHRTSLTEGDIEFEFENAPTLSGSSLDSVALPPIRVFNRDFVNATLQSIPTGIAPIYYLGASAVEKQTRLERQRILLDKTTAKLAEATTDVEVAENRVDAFCRAQARLVKEVLVTVIDQTYSNYDKRRFKQRVEHIRTHAQEQSTLAPEVKAQLLQQKNAQPKQLVAYCEPPPDSLAELAARVAAIIGRVEQPSSLDDRLVAPRFSNWTREGLSLHSGEHRTDQCRFCSSLLAPGRRKALEEHFNQAYSDFENLLDALGTAVNSAQRCCAGYKIPAPVVFYDHLAAKAASALAVADAARAADVASLEELATAIKAKKAAPFADDLSLARPLAEYRSVLTPNVVAAVNAVIREHKELTDNFAQGVKQANEQLELNYATEAEQEYTSLFEKLSEAQRRRTQIVESLPLIQREIDTLEREVLEHRRPADELNVELRDYLGRDELQFEIREAGYLLTRSGEAVSHLSEGERTAIAFLYFLKSLQDKSFQVERGIVVIDDPVSSLDANALFSAFGYMKERTKNSGQLIILTHSFTFFRLIRNWFHHLRGQSKKNVDNRPARFFMLRARTGSGGIRDSHIERLDPLLEQYDSEYHYLFKRVHEEAHRADTAELENSYGMPNVARRLVEAFVAFRYPDLRAWEWPSRPVSHAARAA